MKYKLPLIFVLLIVFILSCKVSSKQNAAEMPTAPALLEVAQNKFPGITQTDLDEGKNILNNDCSRCHGAPKIKAKEEQGWLKVIDRMAPKAKLSDSQKKKLTEYVLSVNQQNLSN